MIRGNIARVRELFGDLEDAFRQATGYGFDGLTASEARYLANFRPTDTVRARILEEADQGSQRSDPVHSGEVNRDNACRRPSFSTVVRGGTGRGTPFEAIIEHGRATLPNVSKDVSKTALARCAKTI